MKLKLFLLFALVSVFSSCLKEDEVFVPNTEYGDIETLLKNLDQNLNALTIDPTIDNTIVTLDNNVIIIPANSLVYQENKQPVQGLVSFMYAIDKSNSKNILKARDSKVTDKNQSVLFNVELDFIQAARNIEMNNSSQGITIKVPYTSNDNDQKPNVYNWETNAWTESNGSIKNANWEISSNSGTIFGIGYEMILNQKGDFMVSRPYSNANVVSLCLTLPEIFTKPNTVVYAIIADKGLSYKLEFSNNKFCSEALPMNEVVRLVSISDQKEKYYISENSFKLDKSYDISAVPKLKTINEINEWILSF